MRPLTYISCDKEFTLTFYAGEASWSATYIPWVPIEGLSKE